MSVTFIVDELIAEAKAETKLDDFGQSGFEEGLGVLAETYDQNVTDPKGRARCRGRLVTLLATRLRIEEAFKQIPEIRDEVIAHPLFVTGLPRSGTSALINLLGAAPDNRPLLQWECHFPDPWPGSKQGDEDPRYAPMKAYMEKQKEKNKAFQKIHDASADTPEECVLLHAYAMDGVQLGFEIMMEPYGSWAKAHDLTPMYEYFKDLLKMLQWRHPGKQWVLKAPAHMWAVDVINNVFPDAKFVWCHRKPIWMIPSICSMNETVMDMYMGPAESIDKHKLADNVMDWYAESLEIGLTERAKLDESRFIDCSQEEFANNPMSLLQRIYQQFDFEMDDANREAFETHITTHPKGRHGKHVYDLERFGMTEDKINQRFDFYVNDARWPLSN